MRASSPRLCLALTSIVATTCTFASEYSYPIELRLGAGVDSSEPLEPFPYCFEFKRRPIQGSGTTSQMRATVVKSRRELLRELNVSVAASARSTFFSGSAKASVDEKYSFSSDSVTWMVYLNSNLGSAEIYDERLSTEAKALLTANRHSEFAQRCGDELVQVETRTATVAAIFTATAITSDQQRLSAMEFKAEAKGAAWDADAASRYRNFVRQASATSSVSLDVIAVGGEGPPKLGSLIKDFSDLNEIAVVLSAYAKTLTFENAKSTSFKSTSMKRYGWKGQQLAISKIDAALADYYVLYRDADRLKQRSYDLLRADSAGEGRLTATQRDRIQKLNSDADALSRALIDTAQKCRAREADCLAASTFHLPIAVWPKTDPVGRVTQVSSTVRCDPASVVAVPPIANYCSQEVILQIAGRWADVVNIDAWDHDGSAYPVAIGEITQLGALYDKAKQQSGGSLTEASFTEQLVGESYQSVASAMAAGWSVRQVKVNAAFGSTTKTDQGLRKPVSLRFRTSANTVEVRDVFLY